MTPDQLNNPAHYTEAVVNTWKSFLPALEQFEPEDRREIKSIFKLAVGAHRGQPRTTNDEYHISHVVETTRILISECEIKDPIIVKVALLHDTVEDSSFFGDPTSISYNKWIQKSRKLLTEKNVDKNTINMVLRLTKPQVNGIDVMDKPDARLQYYQQLRSAPAEVLLVKMADRLHNLRTQYETSPEQKNRKIAETKEVYLGIFQRARIKYPNEAEYLIDQINQELVKLEADSASQNEMPSAGIVFQAN